MNDLSSAKTFIRSYLPESITYNGKVLKLDAISSGIANGNVGTHTHRSVIYELRKAKKSVVIVEVLSKNLKGKTDLHGKPYQPTKFIFTN